MKAMLVLLMGLLAVGGASPGLGARVSHGHQSSPCGTASQASGYQHVVWIVMENKRYDHIIGSPDAPYINSLAKQCGLATNFYAEAHPSLPNYIAMTSGSTQGITDDKTPAAHPLAVPSIFSQLGSQGWRALEEGMTANCWLSDSGSYVVHHNPAAYYTTIRSDCQNQDIPLASKPDVSAAFTFITPDNCHNMHSCPVSTGDAWLAAFLPSILTSRTYAAGDTAVFLTWDEAEKRAPTNHIPTIVIAPSVPAGTQSATAFTHYSMLRTAEELLGLPMLGNAATASSMRTDFHL
ncbi:MAG TPA: alkaline phosphatase family protein [Gaiellales bacterium]|jgi:hypothetical protein|nr:alkaline phosphatase family protein [Gaiellales bacterium]